MILTRSWWFGRGDKGKHCAFVQDRTVGKKRNQQKLPEPLCMFYSKCKKKMTPYLYEQEKKEICLCARGRREGERWDASPERTDYLEMSHPAQAHASCPCLTEGDPLSHGVRARQGSAGAEIHPRDQKILQVPWVASQSTFAGGRRVRSNSRDW